MSLLCSLHWWHCPWAQTPNVVALSLHATLFLHSFLTTAMEQGLRVTHGCRARFQFLATTQRCAPGSGEVCRHSRRHSVEPLWERSSCDFAVSSDDCLDSTNSSEFEDDVRSWELKSDYINLQYQPGLWSDVSPRVLFSACWLTDFLCQLKCRNDVSKMISLIYDVSAA